MQLLTRNADSSSQLPATRSPPRIYEKDNSFAPFSGLIFFVFRDCYFFFLRTQTRCLEENEEKPERERKFRMKKEANREATIGFPEDYAEELSPLLLPGRRSDTGAGWLGDAGEYCGDTGEDCDAGVLNCEYGGETVENCEAGV